MVYHIEYDGYYNMSWHDREQNALKRWFDNYKIDRYASFAWETEWLVVKEIPSSTRKKIRMICEIGDDGRGTKREVIMDHTAPPPPFMTFAAKRRYEPPPPKTAEELRREAEWNRMFSMGYEPIRKPRPPLLMKRLFDINASVTIEYDIEWVPRRQSYFTPPSIKTPAPPPSKYRRNV